MLEYSRLILPISHLSDTSHREIYEAAHSVILAVFSRSAQKPAEIDPSNIQHEQENLFIASMVPFYVQCLIEVGRNYVLPRFPNESLELCRRQAQRRPTAPCLCRPSQERLFMWRLRPCMVLYRFSAYRLQDVIVRSGSDTSVAPSSHGVCAIRPSDTAPAGAIGGE